MAVPLEMEWRHLLFENWPVDPDTVATHLPPALDVDEHDGSAWLSVVPFANRAVRPKGLPRDFAVRLLREEYDFITVKDSEQMYCYDDETGVYQSDARQVVKERLEEMLRSRYSRREKNEILARLKLGGYIEREEFGQSGS